MLQYPVDISWIIHKSRVFGILGRKKIPLFQTSKKSFLLQKNLAPLFNSKKIHLPFLREKTSSSSPPKNDQQNLLPPKNKILHSPLYAKKSQCPFDCRIHVITKRAHMQLFETILFYWESKKNPWNLQKNDRERIFKFKNCIKVKEFHEFGWRKESLKPR